MNIWNQTAAYFGSSKPTIYVVFNATRGMFVSLMGETDKLEEAQFYNTESAAHAYVTAMAGFKMDLKVLPVELTLKK